MFIVFETENTFKVTVKMLLPICHQLYFCTPDRATNRATLATNMRWHDLFCFGRPGLQADNVMYTNAHTLCW